MHMIVHEVIGILVDTNAQLILCMTRYNPRAVFLWTAGCNEMSARGVMPSNAIECPLGFGESPFYH